MALDTYTDLQGAVGRWMARDDLNANVPDYIKLFETWINRVLVARPSTTTAELTPTAGAATLPADFLMARRLTWGGSPTNQLTYVTPDYFYAAYTSENVDTPGNYTIEGNTLRVDSNEVQPITLSYAQKVPPLTEAEPTNWLLTDHFDLYLWGTLMESNAYVQDAQTAILWKQRRDECLRELQLLTFRGPIGPIQPTGATP